jgi:DNA repair ATPase RecN
MRLDIGDIVGRIQQQVASVTGNAKTATELLDILRDAHRVLLKIEAMVDRIDETAQKWESKLSNIEVSPERLARLEKAVFNIERATMGVEATMGSLPRVLRTRIERRRQPAAGDTLPDWDQPGVTPEP